MADLDGNDLVEYMVVVASNLDAVPDLADAVAGLAANSMIRILDAVVVTRERDGTVEVYEVSDNERFHALQSAENDEGCLLSDQDIALAALAMPAGNAGIILVVEDSWAEPLSAAARNAGGQILAGERIPARRVTRVMRELSQEDGS